MARLPRICLPGIAQHVIQRGNNRQVCFGSQDDFAAYTHWLEEYARKYHVAVHAWVFMTNHVHLLLTPDTPDGVSRLMQSLGRRYVRYFNHTYRRSGTLWEGRFKSCVVENDNYLLLCQRYIELNPVRAGMVDHPSGYAWSSYAANGRGKAIKLWTPHPTYLALGRYQDDRTKAYRDQWGQTRLILGWKRSTLPKSLNPDVSRWHVYPDSSYPANRSTLFFGAIIAQKYFALMPTISSILKSSS